MIIVFIRGILLYILAVIAVRIMGKGELAEMQPFELVIIIMIAELAVLPLENLGVPLLNGFAAIAALLFMQTLISFITLKSEKARKIICGKPSILINKGKINQSEMKRLRININDLLEQLRIKSYPSINDVEYAILETNGELSIIPKPDKMPVTVGDLNLKTSYEGLPVSVIIDGSIKYDNLKKINLNEDWLKNQLKVKGIKNAKEVLFSFVDANKNIFIHKKDEK